MPATAAAAAAACRLGLKKLRFKPAFNPYTEPSMEIFRQARGCRARHRMHGWRGRKAAGCLCGDETCSLLPLLRCACRAGFGAQIFPFCHATACSYSEQLGKWIEVGNSGMFRPEMLRPMGLPEGVNVIAWGLGLER